LDIQSNELLYANCVRASWLEKIPISLTVILLLLTAGGMISKRYGVNEGWSSTFRFFIGSWYQPKGAKYGAIFAIPVQRN
jgi:hypothetical protein